MSTKGHDLDCRGDLAHLLDVQDVDAVGSSLVDVVGHLCVDRLAADVALGSEQLGCDIVGEVEDGWYLAHLCECDGCGVERNVDARFSDIQSSSSCEVPRGKKGVACPLPRQVLGRKREENRKSRAASMYHGGRQALLCSSIRLLISHSAASAVWD